MPNHATGADGVKIAVLRKGRTSLNFLYAAAHRRRYTSEIREISGCKNY